MIDMDNVMLGDIGLGSPLLTKLQAMQSLFGGYYDQQQGSASAFNYVCPSSSSVNDNIYLHDADQLSTQQALHHDTISHDIRLFPFDSSSAPPPSSHAHQLPAVVHDAALINIRINPQSHVNTTSRQEKGGQEGDPKPPCLSYATSLADYLSQGSFGCSLSSASPFDTQLARHLQYYDRQVTSESFQPDDNILIASDVQDSNTSGSVNCVVNGSGRNPPKAALSTSTSTSSTPSNISNAQLAQVAKETLQAWMAYDTSSFNGKKSAFMNINSASKMVNEGANKKKNGTISANSSEQKKRRKKRRRISHKNVEEMETQRMTHIAVERNRRKQMNEHLRALRSLMPQSYIQRGDQASIVGGTIRFVEELEQVLQSLRLQKQLRVHHIEDYGSNNIGQHHELLESPVDEIHANTQSCMANVEVTMLTSKKIFLKVLAHKKPHQLLETLLTLSSLSLRVTHLNITTVGVIIVYSFNLEMEKSECQLLTPCELAESIKHTLCV